MSPRSAPIPTPDPSRPGDLENLDSETRGRIFLHAVTEGDLGLVKRMVRSLGAAAVKEIKNSKGLPALNLAAGNGRLEVCEYLVEDLGFDVNLSAGSLTPLHHCVIGNNSAAVGYLLDHGTDAYKKDAMGDTTLHTAARVGNCEITRLLLSKGVDVDAESNCGPPLHAAAANGNDAFLQILLEHGADPNKVLHGCLTPLTRAAKARSLKCLELLIKAGADVNYFYMESPLTTVLKCDLPGGVKYLMEAGADPNVSDSSGEKPILIAARHGELEVVKLLFPCTTPVPAIQPWSINGILAHVENEKKEDSLVERKDALKSCGDDAFQRREYLQALSFYAEAINLDPTDATLYANRSICWLREGCGQQALFDANSCRRIRPDWSKACYRQGAAFMLLKEYEAACQAFKEGLVLNPGNTDMQRALREATESLEKFRAENED